MTLRFVLLIVLTIAPFFLIAQERRGTIGYGVSAGATNYAGELDDNFSPQFTRLGVGAHAIFVVMKKLHVRISYMHGRIGANDDAALFSSNLYRNLSFYSDIDEAAISFLYKFQNRRRGFSKRNFLVPYLFVGGAGFAFNPKAKFNGEVYALQKIGTEGQQLSSGNYPKPYLLKQFSIPFGAGFSLKVSETIDIGGEAGLRKTFTDYLDDVSTRYPDKQQLMAEQGPIAVALSDPSNDPSRPNGKDNFAQRGNPANKDWYAYTNLHITFYFSTYLFKTFQPKNQFRENTCKDLMKPKK